MARVEVVPWSMARIMFACMMGPYAEPASARKREPMHTARFEGVVDAARQIARRAVRTPLIEIRP